ncbi:LacI family DNA-binding transcriptional regulator [Palleronia sp. KMU-117]|uniref:LacI family DNA-binding transcriptional regulator n=1 Tax=Palleronia sp. KMU-117 TaxID=3434108 RepID=UPI003D704E22
MRPTLADVAAAAQVSPATVDRVLHDRPGVSRRSRALVLSAARRLGYLPDLPEAPAPLGFHLVLPAGANAYIAELARQARAQAAPHVTVEILRAPSLDAAALAATLAHVGPTDGVAVVALNHPALREAIRGLAARGVPLVTLASDIADAPRVAYVGIDNIAAGRLAGYTLGRFLGPGARGAVAFVVGHLGYSGHAEREVGFRQVLAEEFPHLDILALRESRDDRARARAETLRLLSAHPGLAGLYNAGGGTVGIAAALAEAGRRDVVTIAHELTAENRGFLIDGILDAVIDQSPAEEMRAAFAALSAAARGQPVEPPRLSPRLILRENLP